MLLQLPVELILHINSYLHPVDSVSFGLACTALFAALPFGNIAKIADRYKLYVLMRLERDDPNLTVCFKCEVLWSLNVQAIAADWKNRSTECEHHAAPTMVPFFGSNGASWCSREMEVEFTVPFPWVRLIMRRHFYGESFGLPLSILQKSYSFDRRLQLHPNDREYNHHSPFDRHRWGKRPVATRGVKSGMASRAIEGTLTKISCCCFHANLFPFLGDPGSASLFLWHFDHDFDARIIKNELYLRRTHRMTSIGKIPPEGIQLGIIDNLRIPVCRHMRLWMGPLSSVQNMCILQQVEYLNTILPEYYCHRKDTKVRHKALRSCSRCATDCLVSIDWGYEKGCTLELSTYHRLGHCQMPRGLWEDFFAIYPANSYRPHDPLMTLGAIHRTWHVSRGEEDIVASNGIPQRWGDSTMESRREPHASHFPRHSLDVDGDNENTERYRSENKTWYCGCTHGQDCRVEYWKGHYWRPDRWLQLQWFNYVPFD